MLDNDCDGENDGYAFLTVLLVGWDGAVGFDGEQSSGFDAGGRVRWH